MEGASMENALDRIEAALARVEQAARAPAPTLAPDADLAARHERLRAAVAQSLRQLDGLIAGGGS
jgi:hypothetical protein